MFEELKSQPLSEMPIWARLKFAEMVPHTYSYEADMSDPRFSGEATITEFRRDGDVVWIYFNLYWRDWGKMANYIWPATKT
jgi:hypothetical protein